MKPEVIIIGGCGGAKVAYEIFEMSGHRVFFLNCHVKDWGSLAAIKPKILSAGAACEQIEDGAYWFVATGDNQQREILVKEFFRLAKPRLANCVHPEAIYSKYSDIGHGSLICAGAILGVDASLGNGVIVNTAASVDHDCKIGEFSQIGPGAHVCGYVEIGDRVFVGAGAVILPHIKVGQDAVVAAGAVVTKDVGPHEMVAGVPAERKKVLA